ncbi:hypothetical protein [Halovenus halobia]|uniref:hypothetical protein n=1 Tax=Halovenus halobia TaxID=3396622 RepID=UPI003F54614F
MSSSTPRKSKSIYEWLSCPECGSRDVVRGPRFEDGFVELRCDDCELTAHVGL